MVNDEARPFFFKTLRLASVMREDVLPIRRGIEWEIGLGVIKHYQHEL